MDLFVSIGTSGNAYSAAGYAQTARYLGARTLEMNLEPSLGIPRWVGEMLASRNPA